MKRLKATPRVKPRFSLHAATHMHWIDRGLNQVRYAPWYTSVGRDRLGIDVSMFLCDLRHPICARRRRAVIKRGLKGGAHYRGSFAKYAKEA